MFSQHVSQKLSAYCHNELAGDDAQRVAEHLNGCQRCRRELEEIKLGVALAGQLPRASAPASLWREIEAKLQERSRPATLETKPMLSVFAFDWRVVAAACAVLLLAFGTMWLYVRQPNRKSQVAADDELKMKQTPAGAFVPAWDVARLAGAPLVGVERVEGSSRLAVGEWLETDASSRARINVANIGQVEIEPNSRVRLVATGATEHRLAMTHGQLRAVINAPPRLFIVDTPSAVAVDLGCAYTLDVDDAGRSMLHVTSGWVALEKDGRESLVPAGAVCVTEPGKGPGVPYFDDTSEKFQAALSKLTFENGGAKELTIVLAEAREYDTLTLWHLLSRVEGSARRRVYERMASLAPPPEGVTQAGVLRLNKEMLDRWKKALEWAWFE